MSIVRTYSELVRLETFHERFEYLRLRGSVGASTFGFDRYMNQMFYRSREWKLVRQEVITRDLGCDLGIEGYEIHDGLYIHHMNPITKDILMHDATHALDKEQLITTTFSTHNAIHYGRSTRSPREFVERRPNDTKLW